MTFTLARITPEDDTHHTMLADLLVAGFREHWPNAWPDRASGLEDVRDVLARGFALAALDGDQVVGWIGGLPEYDGHVCELHPLVVRPERQGQGIGRLLVRAFEAEARQRGAVTAMLGTDDEDSMTTLAGVDLYDDLWGHVARIRNIKGHPYTFYQKMGYTIVGVLPDANGPGKPDIYMAKRLI